MTKRLPWLLLLVALTLPAYSRSPFSGWAERGGQNVLVNQAGVTTKAQRSCPNATISVRLVGTVTLATLYSDIAGTAKANPFTASSTGYYSGWIDDGTYDVLVSCGVEWSYTSTIEIGSSGTYISASSYGTIGTGVDSALAINAAIDAARALGGLGGNTVLLPQGDIHITTSIVLKPRVSLVGTGAGATRIIAQAAVPMIDLTDAGNQYDSVIENLRLDLNNLGTYGIKNNLKNSVIIRNVRIQLGTSNPDAIGIYSSAWFNLIEHVALVGPGFGAAGTAIGILLDDSSNGVLIRHCSIADFPLSGYAIKLHPATVSQSHAVIRDNLFDTNTLAIGLTSGNADFVVIDGNRGEGNTQFLDVVNNVEGVRFSNNYCDGNASTTHHVVLRGPGSTTEGNYFRDHTVGAIQRAFNCRGDSHIHNEVSGAVPLIDDGNTSEPYVLISKGATAAGNGLIITERILTRGATAHTSGNYALSAGFGDTAAVSAITATDQRGVFTVTANGSGIGANPTATITFGTAWTAAPGCVAMRGGGSQPTVPVSVTGTTSTTTLTITFNGTPIAAETYIIRFMCI